MYSIREQCLIDWILCIFIYNYYDTEMYLQPKPFIIYIYICVCIFTVYIYIYIYYILYIYIIYIYILYIYIYILYIYTYGCVCTYILPNYILALQMCYQCLKVLQPLLENANNNLAECM